MKARSVLISLLFVALLAPMLAEAARVQMRTRGVYSDANPDSSAVSRVVVAACLANEAATGGGCACFGENTNFDTTNDGFQVSCRPSGDGTSFVGLCVANPGTYNQNLGGPGITVYVHCAVRGKIVRSTATPDQSESDLIQVPADQVNESNLSLQALQTKQILERQAQTLSERTMQQNEKEPQQFQ